MCCKADNSKIIVRKDLFMQQKIDLILKNEQKDFFLDSCSSQKLKLVYKVAKGIEFKVVVVDFSTKDFNFDLEIELEEDSSSIVKLSSVCLDCKKHFTVNVTHKGKNSFSRTIMSGINCGKGSLRFLGNSLIINGATGSDTRQEGKITNLSPDAISEVSPALLIKENDVKASHGAALGAYNPDVIFYLMSRGLSLAESKKLIMVGNVYPIIDSLQDESAKQKAKSYMEALSL